MKIIFFETSIEEETELKNLIKNSQGEFEAKFTANKLSAENIASAKGAEVISVFINSPIDKAIIDQLPDLKFITTRSMGFDHIDYKYGATKGIAVSNVPAYGARTVAEYTFALMLGLSRKAFLAYGQVKAKHDFDYANFEGFNLMGKTLGVIGTGRIGMNVIEIAIRGFQMKVLAYDPYPNLPKAKELGFDYVRLEQLLPQSDIVTIHVPLNDTTHHLINKTTIKMFKPGAMLINTARGEVVDTEAIMDGVNQNILAAAGLDVLEGERELKEEWMLVPGREDSKANADQIKTMLEDHMLIDMPKIAITPHIAFFTKEARKEILQITIDNILGFAANTPKNLVK